MIIREAALRTVTRCFLRADLASCLKDASGPRHPSLLSPGMCFGVRAVTSFRTRGSRERASGQSRASVGGRRGRLPPNALSNDARGGGNSSRTLCLPSLISKFPFTECAHYGDHFHGLYSCVEREMAGLWRSECVARRVNFH